MKKFFTLILAAMVLTCSAACDSKTAPTEEVSERTAVDVQTASVADEEGSEESEVVSEAESEAESETEEISVVSEEDSEEAKDSDSESESSAAVSANDTGVFTMGKFSITLPEGFTVEEEGSMGIAYAPDYPEHSDNYTFTSIGSEQSKSEYSKEALEDMYSSVFEDFHGIDVYEEETCNGYDAVNIKYTLTYGGFDMEQRQYYVFTDDDMYIVTFTTDNTDYIDAYEQSLKTIVIE